MYTDDWQTWTIGAEDPNSLCTYDASDEDTVYDVSAVTDLGGDADGWITRDGALLVIEDVHAKWQDLALWHYDEDELEDAGLSEADTETVLEYAVDPEIRDCNTECVCAEPYPSEATVNTIRTWTMISLILVTIVLVIAASIFGGFTVSSVTEV